MERSFQFVGGSVVARAINKIQLFESAGQPVHYTRIQAEIAGKRFVNEKCGPCLLKTEGLCDPKSEPISTHSIGKRFAVLLCSFANQVILTLNNHFVMENPPNYEPIWIARVVGKVNFTEQTTDLGGAKCVVTASNHLLFPLNASEFLVINS